jgi:ankyrin repeat protein
MLQSVESVAARCGHVAPTQLLLSAGARIDSADENGNTACHASISRAHVRVLEVLLAHSPDLARANANERTALDFAFQYSSDVQMATMLVEAGAPLEHDGVPTARWCLLASGTTASVRALLKRGIAVSELRDVYEQTPLHLAAFNRTATSDVLDLLVNVCCVDLEARDLSHRTCIDTAVERYNAGALRFMIAAGANVHCSDTYDRTPLHKVVDRECTILLLAAGADVHLRDCFGRTPLLSASVGYIHDANVVRLILHAMLAVGADLNAVDNKGFTVFHLLATHWCQLALKVDDELIVAARRDIAVTRLEFVRHRAWQVCIGLQSRGLDSLQMCEILRLACGPMARFVAFHHWWKIATTVKHHKSQR